MPLTEKISRRVEFRDTDAAGIMHFSAYFTMMEEAEHEFLRHQGLSVVLQDQQGTISWPRVSAHCDFLGAVKFEDLLDIEVHVSRLGEKSVTFAFLFTHEGSKVATGTMASVCCRLSDEEPPESIPIPDWISQKLTSADN